MSMTTAESNSNAIALTATPLFASSLMALYMVLRAQLGDGQRPEGKRRDGAGEQPDGG